ncbi:hypothetical protein [Pseudonocardia adelaidensis]|uniref:hypothetical protein n=1 Tax=Pseudonocardia adelaidensis TaxID=648754 RepID=UPI0031ECE7AF
MSGVRYRVDTEVVAGGEGERERSDAPPRRDFRRAHWSVGRLFWWRHPGYIGVRRRDFYAWRRA